MHERMVWIEADDEETALQEAANGLGVVPADIQLETLCQGHYRATLKNADAEIGVQVSPDGLEARVVAYAPPVGDGRSLSLSSLKNQIERAGVAVDPSPDPDAVIRVFEWVAKGLSVRGIVIARGIPAKDGKDGRLQLAVEGARDIGPMQQDERARVCERATVPSVRAGNLIGHAVPPEKGIPGRDVRGKLMPAKEGQPLKVVAGPNVEASEDGLEFRSKINGVVVLTGNVLSVNDAFEVDGDVGLSSGNIRVDHASVLIKGTIRGGFKVFSGGDLTVNGGIETAVVEAVGDVRVGRAIVMRTGGCIKAGGSVVADVAENATIDAEGNVLINNDITNCNVLAHGKVIATKGKGRIQGGTVRCCGGVEANEIGSPLGVLTRVTVGLESEAHAGLVAELDELQRTVRTVDTALGTGDPAEILQRTAVSEREKVAETLKTRIAARERIEEIEAMLEEQRELLKRSCASRIKVTGVVHPGAVLTIAGRSLEVLERICTSQAFYDPETDSICVAPL